ncbi:prolipoprotein diacylglyceryl transferase family protein [Nonomuraea typhae]|uniref:Prolipoprotein diacylglyceryl transferase family protein n=1 Tax=Nonomuraea typhae TaxID=2603600 RepID=A0ABW7YLS4_9ACTN
MEEVVAVTYWFEPAPEPPVQSATLRLTGRRLGVHGTPGERDRFTREVRVEDVPAGGGPVSVTAAVDQVNPGVWDVSARMVRLDGPTGSLPVRLVHPAAWSWRRRRLLTGDRRPVRTRPAGRTRPPGILAGGRRVLMTAGFVVGLAVTAALLAGLRGLSGQPVGAFLDATAPGLLYGVAVGRLGCFLGGCCAGRPTGSRFGVWASDRRVGVRRYPAQLLESLLALVAASLALAALVLAGPYHGVIFAAALGLHATGRRAALALRADRRPSRLAGSAVAGLAVGLAGIYVCALV